MTTVRSTRNPELDGLRGVAVIMVLLWHFLGIPAWLTATPLCQSIFNVLVMGGAGVDLFFVLSGFLITRIALDNSHRKVQFLWVFYLRRALRILPPYFLLLTVFLAVVKLGVTNEVFNDSIPLWRLLSLTQNFWMVKNKTYGPDGIGVTWSVAIEEQYYWVFPILMIVFRKRILPLLILIGMLSVGLRVYLGVTDPVFNAYAVSTSTLTRLDGLAFGGVIACLGAGGKKITDYKNVVGWFVVILSPGLLFVNRVSTVNMAFYGHTFLSVYFALILLFVMSNLGGNGYFVRFLRTSPLKWFGKISYSMYLFHPLILALGFLAFQRPKNLGGSVEFSIVIGSFVISVVVAALLNKFLEDPFIRFGHKFKYRK